MAVEPSGSYHFCRADRPAPVDVAKMVPQELTGASQKVALVTGAGRGIGRATAVALARCGYDLCLAARTFEELEETRRLSGLAPPRALIVLIDLADAEAPANLFDAALGHFGRLDVLVNNAGWAPPRTPLVKLRAGDLERMVAVNLRAPIALARLAAIQMTAQDGGVIVNIASAAARNQAAGETVYTAVKAGLVAFTRCCFAEFRQSGVRTAVIIPGLTDTTFIPQNKRLDRAAMLRPDDVASAVLGVVNAAPGASPLEVVLEPTRDPMRTG
ncbi:MAG: SDR family oxidoreductase [Candidatus Binataceae bacterium]